VQPTGENYDHTLSCVRPMEAANKRSREVLVVYEPQAPRQIAYYPAAVALANSAEELPNIANQQIECFHSGEVVAAYRLAEELAVPLS
jgi:hypothetical protein